MRAMTLAAMLGLLIAVLVYAGPAAAQDGEQPLPEAWARAGVAIVQPLDGGDSIQALDLSLKLLPVPEPKSLTLATVPQYLAANLHVDALLHTPEGRIPRSLDRVRVTPGVSLPLLLAGDEKSGARGGLAYVADRGLAVFAAASLSW